MTGGNKGIGYETCKQLASNGVVVVLTSRDEKRGIEAMERLKKELDITDQILFHQLDVMDTLSISSLVNFINTKFGRLDILVTTIHITDDLFLLRLRCLKEMIYL